MKKKIDLGYVNGWLRKPKIYERCQKKAHELTREKVGRCITEYTCPICNFSFRLDSSD